MMPGRPDSQMSLKDLVFQSTKSKMSSSDTGSLNIAYIVILVNEDAE
jgi:hypothetical protein